MSIALGNEIEALKARVAALEAQVRALQPATPPLALPVVAQQPEKRGSGRPPKNG